MTRGAVRGSAVFPAICRTARRYRDVLFNECVPRITLLIACMALATAATAVGATSTQTRTFTWNGKACTATFVTPPPGARARLVRNGPTPYLRVTKGTRAWESYPRSLQCRESRPNSQPGAVRMALRGLTGAFAVDWTVPSGGGRGLAVTTIELRGARAGSPIAWDQMVPLARLAGGAPGRKDSALIEVAPGTWRIIARATNNALALGPLSRPVTITVR